MAGGLLIFDIPMQPLIVHVSAAYPDACEANKTLAVSALVEGTADRLNHRVYSLNRTGAGLQAFLSPGRTTEVADDGVVASWRYAAPARSIALARSMEQVADTIVADIRARGLRPALIQGHKLSFEGIAARRIARALNLPYALTLQGNSDQKIAGTRRDLRPLYRRVWSEAAAIFSFAPWIARWCEETLGPPAAPCIDLPCIPVADAILPPRATGPRIITAFHMEYWRNKNIVALAAACARLKSAHPGLTLEIAGGGDSVDERAVDRVLESAGISGFARRVGPVPGNAIQQWMNGAAVLALPSKRESFGMVFIEALLAGCPIVYPSGAAVDGYFDGAPFALGVNTRDINEIAASIDRLLREADARKAGLADWQRGSAAAFRKPAILARYAETLVRSL